ncbi:MAG: helix-turn-helix transcriptional regulator [Bacteroidales bacterium]|nr:helix-turn-helix transcriptional regulator [Bacteroidales bacterium]
MKQPELGRKISELRKAKGLTQEELVEKCNIGVRTIQRIETGEVTPRSYTIKAILGALECGLQSIYVEEDKIRSDKLTKGLKRLFLINVETSESSAHIIKQLNMAWVIGLICFVLSFFEFIGDYYHLREDRFVFTIAFYLFIKVAVLVTSIFFQRGFVLIGSLFKNYLLKIVSIMFIACTILITVYDLATLSDESISSGFVMGGFAFTFGSLYIVFGVALMRMNYLTGTVANYAGVFSIITGCCYLTLIGSILAFILLVPLELLQIIMLFKVSEILKAKQRESCDAFPPLPIS